MSEEAVTYTHNAIFSGVQRNCFNLEYNLQCATQPGTEDSQFSSSSKHSVAELSVNAVSPKRAPGSSATSVGSPGLTVHFNEGAEPVKDVKPAA